nr:uncharacterized protein LOC108127554 [Drosophila bipectinata]
MLKFSDIGNSCAAWRHLLRTGRSSLKIKKGAKGHFLDKKCNEELKKSLPEEAYVELMNWVDSWMKKIDKRNYSYTKKDLDPKPGANPKESTSIGNQSAGNLSDLEEDDDVIECVDSNETCIKDVIDLCSDEDSRDNTLTDSNGSNTMSSTTKEDNALSEMTKILDMLETVENFTVRHANEEAFFLIKMLRISLIQGLNL